jgi:hypothetical protein
VAIERNDITDPAFEVEIFNFLVEFGFSPERNGDVIHLSGVGVGSGDNSANININLVEMDGHRILEITSPLKAPGVSFEKATLIAAQGNLSCLIAKFVPVEQVEEGTHFVRAGFALYADHLSGQELKSILYLFIKEVDAIDNNLIDMLIN